MFRHNDDKQLDDIENEYQKIIHHAEKDDVKVSERAHSSVCPLHAAVFYNLCACTENQARKPSPRQRSCEPQARKRNHTPEQQEIHARDSMDIHRQSIFLSGCSSFPSSKDHYKTQDLKNELDKQSHQLTQIFNVVTCFPALCL